MKSDMGKVGTPQEALTIRLLVDLVGSPPIPSTLMFGYTWSKWLPRKICWILFWFLIQISQNLKSCARTFLSHTSFFIFSSSHKHKHKTHTIILLPNTHQELILLQTTLIWYLFYARAYINTDSSRVMENEDNDPGLNWSSTYVLFQQRYYSTAIPQLCILHGRKRWYVHIARKKLSI